MSYYLDMREPLPSVEELMAGGGKLLVIEILRRMPYTEYLETEWWQNVRKETWSRHAGLCAWCGEIGHDVHHLEDYWKCRGRETEKDTVLLCLEHHRLFHENWQLKVRKEGERQFREN